MGAMDAAFLIGCTVGVFVGWQVCAVVHLVHLVRRVRADYRRYEQRHQRRMAALQRKDGG